MFIKNR